MLHRDGQNDWVVFGGNSSILIEVFSLLGMGMEEVQRRVQVQRKSQTERPVQETG